VKGAAIRPLKASSSRKTRSIVDVAPSVRDSDIDLAEDVERRVCAIAVGLHKKDAPHSRQMIFFTVARKFRVSARLISRLRICFNGLKRLIHFLPSAHVWAFERLQRVAASVVRLFVALKPSGWGLHTAMLPDAECLQPII